MAQCNKGPVPEGRPGAYLVNMTTTNLQRPSYKNHRSAILRNNYVFCERERLNALDTYTRQSSSAGYIQSHSIPIESKKTVKTSTVRGIYKWRFRPNRKNRPPPGRDTVRVSEPPIENTRVTHGSRALERRASKATAVSR